MRRPFSVMVFSLVSIAVITNFLSQLEHLNSDEVPGWTWVGWSRFFGYMILAAFITYYNKVFVDQSSSPVEPPEPPEPPKPPEIKKQ